MRRRKKLKFSRNDEALFKLLEQFGNYIDVRKESMLRHSYTRGKFLEKIENRVKYNIKDLHAMGDNEIIDVLENREVDLVQIHKRGRLCAMYYAGHNRKIFYSKEAQRIYDAFLLSLPSK